MHFGLLSIASLSLLLTPLIPEDNNWPIVVLCWIGTVCSSLCFGVNYINQRPLLSGGGDGARGPICGKREIMRRQGIKNCGLPVLCISLMFPSSCHFLQFQTGTVSCVFDFSFYVL